MKPKAKRLTPRSDVLRELYLLSGNNCAIPACKGVIIDANGVVVGQVCHIEAASPEGPRFNVGQTDEERRALSNLVLICAGHHLQIDSKKNEKEWTVVKLKQAKADHERKFKGVGNSLQQAFRKRYVDSTDELVPNVAKSFTKFERLLPYCKIEAEDRPKRSAQIRVFVEKLAKVPDDERDFMVSVIERAVKLNARSVSVDVEDIKSAFGIGHSKIKRLGGALDRYEVGSVDLASTSKGDMYHVFIYDPSDFVSWMDLSAFCEQENCLIEDFVKYLKFDLLDEK